MKNKTFITVVLLFVFRCSFSQYEPVEQQPVFGNRINNPVVIEMSTSADKIIFLATNSSFYPYHLVLNFDFIENLTPEVLFETFVVYPGRKQIFSLNVVDKERQPYCRYSCKFSIGDPKDSAILNYPYLFPFALHKKFDLVYKEDNKTLIQNFFKVGKGDTVFCMRKGDVTATPNLYYTIERISEKPAVEIRHDDGTVMIYENINPIHTFVQAGNTVFPGEPIGIINDSLCLGIKLYSMKGDGTIKRQNINYAVDENATIPFSEKIKNVDFQLPLQIITREMSKKELKKYKKK
jgi:hypothetical protein